MPIELPELIATKQPKTGNTLFIAIDGHGGSGKSTLAKWLAGKLNASFVETDDFASSENPLDWWPLVIERIFEPVKNGAKMLSYPRSKRWEDHQPEPVVNQPVTDIMILEGVSSFRKEYRDYIGLSIFVNTPKEICLRRAAERDSNTAESRQEMERMWNVWLKDEEEYMNRDKPKDNADLVIDGTTPFEKQLFF
jgi:uridine kinase